MNEENLIASQPKGIGGWLILPALGLIITPIHMVFQFTRDLLPALNPETWAALTTPGTNAYHPIWAPLISFEIITSIAMFGFAIWLLILFFKKSKRVPRLFVALLLLLAALQILDQLLAPYPGSSKDLARSIVGAAIWVPYFLKSKRVKNTFIEESPNITLNSDAQKQRAGQRTTDKCLLVNGKEMVVMTAQTKATEPRLVGIAEWLVLPAMGLLRDDPQSREPERRLAVLL